ncbi:unnamed protein product [Prunus armeniaca]
MESKTVKEPRTVPTMRHSLPISSSEERDLVNILPSLSLKPSNLPARDAPWKWTETSMKKKCMRQPQGFEDSAYPTHVCRLRKSLYGLKQAPRAWNAKFTGHLPALGFTVSHSDPSLCVKRVGLDSVILLLYVDDIILTGSKDSLVQEVIDELSAVFEMKDMGRLTYFLGLQISYHDNGDIFVCQTKYARELLAKAGMDTCRPCTTPCKPHCQLLASEGDSLSDPTIYRSIAGALQYLTFTRPDLCYAVNTLVKRILRYIHGTLDHGLTFTSGSWDLHAYSDADWASDVNTRRSTTVFVVYLGNNPVSWQSKKQNSVSRSSTEAEYRALANTTADLAWVRQYIPTEEQVADIFTKELHGPIFLRHCRNLQLSSSAGLAGHGGSKWHQPVILPLPREGGRRCSVKPALRSALLSRNPVTQSLRSSHKVQLLAWNGRARR